MKRPKKVGAACRCAQRPATTATQATAVGLWGVSLAVGIENAGSQAMTSTIHSVRFRLLAVQVPRTPAATPELNATQKWWAAFMGDRAFARARAVGKNATEAGHARARAGADIALSSLPAEYRD